MTPKRVEDLVYVHIFIFSRETPQNTKKRKLNSWNCQLLYWWTRII